MAEKKESFFWTSYSDLMTSLFFIMLTLFILVIVLLHKRMEATEKQLEEIKKVEASTKELGRSKNFAYKAEYKKYVLDVRCFFNETKQRLADLQADTARLHKAGTEIKDFLDRNESNQYLLIIEGQSSKDSYKRNFELSYERALSLYRYWESNGVSFDDLPCEVIISGSGHSSRFRIKPEFVKDENGKTKGNPKNQRFVIHIIPKPGFK